MYDKLLISAGGGIISREQQAEQDNCATIAIGLGGTGISCLRALKKEIYTRVKPDDDKALVAEYKHIKFLAVDTDKSSIGDTGAVDSINSNTEFFNISCPDIDGLLTQAHILQQDPSLQWLKTANTQENGSGIKILSAEAGAGGIRQIGRLLLLKSCKAFVAKLTNMITEARKDLMGNPNLNIHIFTGISGGTGAGTFMDVCYIIQHVLSQMGLAGQAYTCGYFFMPDVNIASGNAPDYIPINGFSSMKELDYAMNYSNNGGQWDQQYDGFRVTTQNPPVKLAHLITATNADGAIRTNGYDYAMRVAVDYVLEYIIKPFVADGDDVDNDGVFSIKSHIANVNRLIEMVDKKHGACYNYCVLGAANAYLPYKEITTYLTSKIFEGFAGLDKQMPFDNDIEAFVQKCGIRYEDIIRALNDKAPQIPNFAVDARELYEQVEGLTPDTIPQILSQMRDKLPAVNGKFTENKAALLDNSETPLLDTTKQIVSLYAKVKKELLQIAVQPDKGPYYAGGILHNLNSKDLINIIRGYITRNSETLAHARADLSLRIQSMENTLRQLQNSGMLNRKKRAEEYSGAVHSYYMQLAKIDLYEIMGEVLTEFSKQLTEMYDGFFGIFADVMNNLQATFDSNLRTLAQPVLEDNRYAMKLMSIQDLQDSLDTAVKAMRIGDLIHGFVSNMLNNPEAWISQDQNKIANAVTTYFLSQLKTYTSKTIIDYLQIKFGVTAPDALQKKIYDEIIMPLGDRSSPLFWADSSVYSLEDSKTLGYLSIPNISDEIKSAAADYKTGHNGIDVRKSWSQDRITIFSFRCGIPMYGYKGVSNYLGVYKTKPVVGSHIYEGSVGDPRDSRRTINITPISCISTNNLTVEEAENLRLYQVAWELGLIKKEAVGAANEYKIQILDADKMIERFKQAESIISSKNISAAKEFLSSIEKEPFIVSNTRFIPNDGYAVAAEIVVKDHVVGSLSHMEMLKEQLAYLEKQTALVESMSAFLNKTSAFDTDIKTFAMATMTGVIKKLNDYSYSYIKNSFGIDEAIELTTIDSEPYGMQLPLYSAFLGFTKLSKEVKEEINKAVKTNLIENPEAVNVALEAIKTTIGGDKANKMIAIAKTSFSEDSNNIITFVTRYSAEVTNFAATR